MSEQESIDWDELDAETQHELVSLAEKLGEETPGQNGGRTASRREFLGAITAAGLGGSLLSQGADRAFEDFVNPASAGTQSVAQFGEAGEPFDFVAEDIYGPGGQGSGDPVNFESVSTDNINNTFSVGESDDLAAVVANATDGDKVVVENGPNRRHDLSSTLTVDSRITLDFRNRIVPTGDFTALETTDIVTLVGRGAPRCVEDVDNNLSSTTDLVQFKHKVYTQGLVTVELDGNGQDCIAFIQDANSLNNSEWSFSVQNPGRDGIRFENVSGGAVDLNAMNNCLVVCNLNGSGRHGVNMIDGKRNKITGLTTGGTGRAFVDDGAGNNLWFWDWEGVSDPIGPVNSNLWLLNGGGWYTQVYTRDGTAGLETRAFVSGSTITLPNPDLQADGLVYEVVNQSGNASTSSVVIDDSGDGAGGSGSFPFNITTDYGSARFYRRGGGLWQPDLGGA